MIQLTPLRQLNLSAPSSRGRPAFLGAASGLVKAGRHFYVVADDELHLGVFGADDQEPGQLIRMFDGALPVAAEERKKLKPDIEASLLLPGFSGYPAGALMCLPSGSRPNRSVGALFALNVAGAIVGAPRVVDLSAVYAGLAQDLPALNIEGATVLGDALLLLQRGNHRHSRNACIRFDLNAVLRALNAPGPLDVTPVEISPVDLGDIDGVPLCFSDVAALPGIGLVFTAIAEDSGDSYVDGPCVGAAIGIVGLDYRVRYVERLAGAPKVEGIHAEVAGQLAQLWLVTDADDANTPARLLTAEICIE